MMGRKTRHRARSILDIQSISKSPAMGTASPLANEVLERLYKTRQPTREAVEANMDFFEDLDRGQAIYIVLYDQGRPTEVLFAGYSFD